MQILSTPDCRLPVLEKCGRVYDVRLRYAGLNQTGEETMYEVRRTVASVLTNGKFSFANAPYAYYEVAESYDGWQVFRAECGVALIPTAD